jgi:hypothetical protein
VTQGSRAASGRGLAQLTWVVLAWLGVTACRASAQDASTVLAVDALLPNPGFANDALGWDLDGAEPLDALGADDGPCVVLRATDGDEDWATISAMVPAVLGGRSLRLRGHVLTLARRANVWMGVTALASNADGSAWDVLEAWDVRFPTEFAEWSLEELVCELPVGVEVLSVWVSGQGDGHSVVDDVSLQVIEHERSPRASEVLSVDALRTAVGEVLPLIAELRGVPWKTQPLVRLLDRETMRAYQRPSAPEWVAGLRRETRALRLLGLWPADAPGLVEVTADVVGGLVAGTFASGYGLVLLSADTPLADLPVLLAHEATHALDDQQHALWSSYDPDAPFPSRDELLAVSASQEGSATWFELVYMLSPETPDYGDLDACFARLVNIGTLRALGRPDVPELQQRRMRAPYDLGANFLTRGRGLQHGVARADVEHALANPPESTEQLLHPETYWDAEQRDSPRRFTLPDLTDPLGEGWALTREDTLGEFQLALLTGCAQPPISELDPSAWTHAPSIGWGYDRYALLERGGEALTVLVTTWDSQGDAEEFADAVRRPEGSVLRRHGDRVVLVVADPGVGASLDLVALADRAGNGLQFE